MLMFFRKKIKWYLLKFALQSHTDNVCIYMYSVVASVMIIRYIIVIATFTWMLCFFISKKPVSYQNVIYICIIK